MPGTKSLGFIKVSILVNIILRNCIVLYYIFFVFNFTFKLIPVFALILEPTWEMLFTMFNNLF